MLRSCLLAILADNCTHVCSLYGLRLSQRTGFTVVWYMSPMDRQRTISSKADTDTKPKTRRWAYGAVGDTCGWFPEHFVNPDGIALADFSAAVYGPEYLALEKGIRVTRMSEAGWAYGTAGCKMGWFPNEFVNSSNVALANFDGSIYGAEYRDLREGDVYGHRSRWEWICCLQMLRPQIFLASNKKKRP